MGVFGEGVSKFQKSGGRILKYWKNIYPCLVAISNLVCQLNKNKPLHASGTGVTAIASVAFQLLLVKHDDSNQCAHDLEFR